MNSEFLKEQAARVRAIADKADPFTKRRLLDLGERCDGVQTPSRALRSLRLSTGPATSIDKSSG